VKNKTRFIPLVIIGAILLSLLAVIPAFSAQGDTAFIDPDDTDESLDWTRQGGIFIVEVDDDDLDVPIKYVLYPVAAQGSTDLSAVSGTVSITANSTMVAREGGGDFSGVDDGDTILVAGQTVREVVAVMDSVEDDADTADVDESTPAMIEVNVPFSENEGGLSIAKVEASEAQYDECSTCAQVESVSTSAVVGNNFILSHKPVVDSGVGSNRLEGDTDTLIGSDDVLVVRQNAVGTSVGVFNLLQNGTVALTGAAPGDMYVAYWGSVKNDTGAAVRLESTSDPNGISVVLTETGPTTGIFQLTVSAGADDDTESDASADPPVLKVGASDTIRLLYKDAKPSRTDRATLAVESTDPTFTALAPENGTKGKESRPDVTAQVTDANSGVDEDSIRVAFSRAAAGSTDIDSGDSEQRVPVDDGRSRKLSAGSGFRITQSASSALSGSDDATVYWWVVAEDAAGNVAVLDRQETKDFLEDDDGEGNLVLVEVSRATDAQKDDLDKESHPDACDADAFIERFQNEDGELAVEDVDVAISADIEGCQPFSYSIDFTEPVLSAAVTGSHWDASSDDDDKTVTDPADAEDTSIRVDFSEDLDADSVDASDFMVKMDEDDKGKAPSDAEVFAGNGNSVFLTVATLDPDAQPIVEVVDEIMDVAGNALESDEVDAVDGIAPSIEVTIAGTGSEGGRPVTDEEIVVSISVNEAVATPKVTVYSVTQSGLMTDDDDDSDEGLTVAGTERNAVLKSEGNYEFKFKSSSAGLYSVFVTAGDATENNQGKAGDKVLPVSVEDDTKALLFEVDTGVADPMITPEETDNSSPFVTLDYTGEGEEYAVSDGEVTEDLDSHGKVTIMSATFNGEDITDALVTSDMVKYLYKASDLGSGEYKVEVTAKDEAGNELESEGMVEIAERKPYSLALAPGWNLVSIPAEPADGDINSVIPADHPARSVLSYDPSIPGAWLTATRSNGGAFEGTLTEITSGRAYWIHTTSFESIKVDIPRLSAGSPVAPPTINIVKGWNMVPVQDVDEDREDVSAKSYFSGLDVSRVYWFDTVGNTWTSVDVGSVDDDGNAADMLQIGKGYWVFTTEEGTLAP
jgi:hypothetical protein